MSASQPAAPAAPVSGFDAFFDDAAIFPPGNAEMPAAVRAHLAMRSTWYAPCVGPFVCPNTRLDELAEELAARGAELDLTLTVPGGPAAAPEAAGAAIRCEQVRLRSVEVPLHGAGIDEAARSLTQPGEPVLPTYVEVPAAAVDVPMARELGSHGLRLKLRTGGTTAEAFPDEDALAGAVTAAVTARLPFKCTAGLHRAVRHRDEHDGFEQHGFLNVLLAVHAVRTGGDRARARTELADHDPDAVAARVRSLTMLDRAIARGLFTSFGTCSITEPLDDLVTLGLVDPQ